MAVRATNDTFESEIGSGAVFVDFYSDSCVPCKRMSPILAEIEDENPTVKAVKLNINYDSETALKYNVTAVPTLIFFKDGSEITRIIGAVKKQEILNALNQLN